MLLPNTPITQETFTPREFFEVIGLGVGRNFNRQAFREFMAKHGPRSHEIIRETREYIVKMTGYEPNQLVEIASHCSFPAREDSRAIKEGIRRQITENLSFLSVYTQEGKEAGLHREAVGANAYTKKMIDHYFPGDRSVKVESEVEIRNDAARLVLMAFNDTTPAKENFDAARKLLLIKYIGEIRNYSEKDEDNDKALEYIADMIKERVAESEKEVHHGAKTDKYLVSKHAPETYATISTEILDKEPKPGFRDGLTLVTPLGFHKTTVIDKAGKDREVLFRVEPRGKLDESRLIKNLRYGCHVGERDLDRNGLRFLFEKREDWEDFFLMFKEEIKNEVREGLCERLDSDIDEKEREEILVRLDNLDDVIEISEFKDSLDGNGFEGSCSSSSKELKVLKFKMTVTRADGRKHKYEFQVFLPDGYADAEYRKGVSWEEYHADRFFRENLDQLMFPKRHYPQLDRKMAHKKVMQLAHEKHWGKKEGLLDQAKKLFTSLKSKAKEVLSQLPWNKAV